MKRKPNHLATEESPYLKQHAYNPVNWYPWSEEALELAKKEDKPILVSIGYATCHWCHVMERESFEDERIADLMNRHFINIKVDREERPDIDHFYMQALQYLGISGGWPLNVFLTPDQKPFTGGTYFPPVPKHNRPSWYQVLNRMNKAFTERRDEVEEQAERLTELIKGEAKDIMGKYPSLDLADKTNTVDPWQDLYYSIRETFDRVEGGFGGAPKFPQASTLMWLKAYGTLKSDQEALDHVRFSLARMVAGGIYDQAGGGFARYAVDRAWKIPHFEKMLYDNALLLDLLSTEQLHRPHPFFKAAIEETVAFLIREMKQESGGFSSAIDADSDGLEGKFYVWSWRQLQEVMSEEEMQLMAKYLDLSPEGNWEDTNILYLREEDGEELDKQLDKWNEHKKEIRDLLDRLLEYRANRNRPLTDTKVLTAWNAMTVSALTKVCLALGEEKWKEEAFLLLSYLHKNHRDDKGELLRTASGNKKQIRAFLDDEAWFIKAALRCLYLQPEGDWREVIEREIEHVIAHYYDDEAKLFFENRSGASDDMPRIHQLYDAGMPSGNAVMVMNLLEASILFNRKEWRELASEMLKAMSGVIARFPSSLSYWAMDAMAEDEGFDEWAVIGPEYEDKIREVLKMYRPFRVVDGASTSDDEKPLLKGKDVGRETLIYLCTDYACRAPVRDIQEIDDF